ncbi:MAG TPA: CoA-transferase [Spirochaetota bacterium]|nr:CoA-transferase [Spirochaetota bacterium]
MTNDKPMNPLEMLAFILSKQIEDHEVIYIGTGLPMVAAILAKKTHAPNITFVYESGGQDPENLEMPWSVGGPMTWRKSPIIMEMSYSFGQAACGMVDKGFLGFAQIDMYGNANTHQIGPEFTNPKVRLTGSGGNNDVSSLVDKLIYVGLQDPTKFIQKVDFITSPGWLEGGDSRKKAGLLNDGPVAVITSAGVYDFEPDTKRMRIKTLHPGVSPELAQLASGFELIRPEGEIPVTERPSKEILEILRNEVDPSGLFISLPS